MKPIKTVKKKKGRSHKKVIEGVNLIKVHYIHIWNGNATMKPLAQLVYANKNKTGL
jgi:hypothetical protein